MHTAITHTSMLRSLFVILSLSLLVGGWYTTSTVSAATAAVPYTATEVTAYTNKARLANNQGSLINNESLNYIAQTKATQMARAGEFAHVLSDGVDLGSLLYQHKYQYQFAGENLALFFTDADEMVDAWLNSPSHRYNLLHQDYRQTGVGIAYGNYGGYNGWFVVQLFSN